MQFKHPEILYFLSLLIVPILVHLFQLRRFKKEYFTNVRFLKQLSIQSRKSSKIKKWLLLGIRLLFLTGLILAFAQPFTNSSKNTEKAKDFYIVLDNSLSMQAKGKRGPLLARAVQELLEETPENSRFSLLTATESYWNTDIQSIQKELQNTQFSAVPFDLDPILTQINARPSANKKAILVITDGLGWQSKQLQSWSESEEITFLIPKAERRNNVAIDSVFIRQTTDDFYEIGVQLSSFGKNNEAIAIGLYQADKAEAKSLIRLKKQKQIVPFTIPKKSFHGFVSLSDSGLEFDNTYYFSIGESRKTKVISIGEPEKSNFLRRIYTDDEFQYQNWSLSQLDYNQVENQETIVLNELDEIPQALQTTLAAFVQKGGNVIGIPSADLKLSNWNSFIQKTAPISFQSKENRTKLVSKIHFEHPIFKNVFEKQITNFQYPNTEIQFSISGSSPSVLSFDDQSPFLVSTTQNAARVSYFTAPLNTENSNFQQSPLIVPVFYQLAVNQSNNQIDALNIGYNSPYIVAVRLDKEGVVRVGNSKEEFVPMQQIVSSKVKLNFGDYPHQAGNYSVFNGKNKIQNISFNYDRRESNLFDTNEKMLSGLNKIEEVQSFFDKMQTENNDNQLWKWFLIFALLLLMAEMAVIRFVK